MTNPTDDGSINSWEIALAEGRLTPEQLSVLEDLVKKGQAANLQAAAKFLDWQDYVINPDEHMYGF